MLDPKNIQALIISFGLTLWDALPVFLVIGASLAIITRTLVKPNRYAAIWLRRRLVAVGGLAYLTLLQSSLVFTLVVLVAIGIAISVAMQRFPSQLPFSVAQVNRLLAKLPCKLESGKPPPQSEIRAMTAIVSELFGLVLLASAVTAFIKVYGSNFSTGSTQWVILVIVAGLLTTLPPGVAAIPAAATTSVSGSFIAGMVWLILATAIETIRVVTAQAQAESTVRPEALETAATPPDNQPD